MTSFRGREWNGEIVTDYRELFSLPAQEEVQTEVRRLLNMVCDVCFSCVCECVCCMRCISLEEEPEFSLLSGGLLPTRHQVTGL